MSQKRAKAIRKAARKQGINSHAPRQYFNAETDKVIGFRRTDAGPVKIKARVIVSDQQRRDYKAFKKMVKQTTKQGA